MALNPAGAAGAAGLAPQTRHDPSFITQLIATAAQVPQTARLRRASAEDALSAYRCASEKADAPASIRPQTHHLA